MDTSVPSTRQYLLIATAALPFACTPDKEILAQSLAMLRKVSLLTLTDYPQLHMPDDNTALFAGDDYTLSPSQGDAGGDSCGTTGIHWSEFPTLVISDAAIVCLKDDMMPDGLAVSKTFAGYLSQCNINVTSSCVRFKPLNK